MLEAKGKEIVREQYDLFGSPINSPSYSIDEVAAKFGVSNATVRNWIKTGYLESVEKSRISKKSVDLFSDNTAGVEKLNSRANKSHKGSHDHNHLSQKILNLITESDLTGDFLGESYENDLSDAHRNKEGIYYTPPAIVTNLLDIKDLDLTNATYCDPCCGSGHFLIRAIELGFKPENCYGYDTDPVAVEITKRRIFEKTGYKSTNILNEDFLEKCVKGNPVKYDAIFTNPPWGKKLEKEKKAELSSLLGLPNPADTCTLFFFASIKQINDNGLLGLLLPDAFFNVASYEPARAKSLQYEVTRLIDYGKPFKGLQAGAVGLVLKKVASNNQGSVLCEIKSGIHIRSKISFSMNPKCIFNVNCSQEESDVITQTFSTPHINLSGNAKWGLGIVTGNNSKFLSEKHLDGYIEVYKGSDIKKAELKPATNFIPSDLTLYQQVAPVELFKAKEKIVYKFISNDLSFHLDRKQRFFLNSANFFIPNESFPVSNETLCELLNSSFMNWIFNKIFNTYKILRSDIETLPIHPQLMPNGKFSESYYLDQLNLEKTKNGTFRIKTKNH